MGIHDVPDIHLLYTLFKRWLKLKLFSWNKNWSVNCYAFHKRHISVLWYCASTRYHYVYLWLDASCECRIARPDLSLFVIMECYGNPVDVAVQGRAAGTLTFLDPCSVWLKEKVLNRLLFWVANLGFAERNERKHTLICSETESQHDDNEDYCMAL